MNSGRSASREHARSKQSADGKRSVNRNRRDTQRDSSRKGGSFVDWLEKRIKSMKAAGVLEDERAGSRAAEAAEREADTHATEGRAETLEPIREPARISLLYESKDGRLCLFEDGDGHLTAVRAENLA